MSSNVIKKNIYESMAAVMEDCGVVAKNDKNPQQGYRYRGIDAVMNALNPALRKNKVFVVPEVLEQTREERTTNKGTVLIYSITKVRYTFYAEDGSSVAATVIGEGMDSGDKSMNKAMSAAFKYACFQTLCIPTEEMRDSEEETHEVQPKKTEAERARDAYPTRDEMIYKIVSVAKHDAIKKWLANQGLTKIEDATDAAVMALYRYYEDRGVI